ncbi:hypothetical protein R3W88_013598 [Solanum pinnatisectum]|uniref:Uncharacterized protein n=1 Tax=Solanum pinnatisectum TaxID=50273 RepID=A0AAV9KRJ7_9SOLN|nr:hypothetical protein R3W88_013598 [Solanum pinnatisectum]
MEHQLRRLLRHNRCSCPRKQALTAAAPLFCARITTYSPLRYLGLDKPKLHVDVVGLGGLGHVHVNFAKALGLKVRIISVMTCLTSQVSKVL